MQELSPLPLGFLPSSSGCSQIHEHTDTHTHTKRQIHMFHMSDPPQFSHPLFTHFKDYYLALIYSLLHHPLAMPVWNTVALKWFRELQTGSSLSHTHTYARTHTHLLFSFLSSERGMYKCSFSKQHHHFRNWAKLDKNAILSLLPMIILWQKSNVLTRYYWGPIFAPFCLCFSFCICGAKSPTSCHIKHRVIYC